MLWVYSLAHFCVDFGCAYFIYSRFLNPWQWTLCLVLYNFCAFAMQAPLGLLCDRINKNAVIAALGCVITALSAFLAKNAVLACIIAGLGNALFHLGGGIDTLNDCGERCAKLGIFVSPGTFGIFFGTRLGRAKALNAYWVIGGLIIMGICLRSFAGSSMAFPWKSIGQWAVINTCAVVFGKTAGGFLADRLGAVRSSLITLGAAALLFLFASHPAAGVLAVFLFNMTMPVTLGALGRMLPGVKGFAFGTLTLALFVGLVPIIAFPSLTGLPDWCYSLTALLSAILLCIGFRKGGLQ